MKLKHLILGAVCALSFQAQAALQLQSAEGWQESAYMEFTGLDESYNLYNAYLSADGGSSWTQLDGELIRSYGSYGRVDALGLKAGDNYRLKVVPVKEEQEVTADAVVSPSLKVVNYLREGFAHTGKYLTTGVGAYNNDGTLKENAVVLYITQATAKTVEMEVAGAETNPCKGLQSIISGYEKGVETRPLCVRFIGLVKDLDSFGSKEEGLQVKGRKADSELNMTFEGVGNDAMLRFGFLVRNAASVEFRNLGVATTIDDDISLDTKNDHIWIHNVDVFYGPNKGGDQKKGDGAIDIKSDSKHVTVAFAHFWDTGKSSMCGMKSETGPNYITYHHNWFDHSDSRHARVRTMSVHMYNNYYDGIAKYGVGATTGSSVFMENNYFRACSHPMLISLQGTDTKNGTDEKDAPTFSGEDGGIIKSFGNTYVGSHTLRTYQVDQVHFDCYEASSRDEQVPSTVTTKVGSHTYDNFDTNASLMYTYTPDAAADVPAVVTGAYGAGRIQHGDLQFSFTSADDALSEVNNDLRNAIDTYESKLVAIIGVVGGMDDSGDDDGKKDDEGTTGGSWEWYWDNSKAGWTTENFVLSGNTTKKTQTITLLDGSEVEVAYGFKLESATSIKFKAPADCKLKVTFQADQTGSIKLDGVKKTSTDKNLVLDITGGDHELTKADSRNIFYMALMGLPVVSVTNQTSSTEAVKVLREGQLLIRRDGRIYNMQGLRVE